MKVLDSFPARAGRKPRYNWASFGEDSVNILDGNIYQLTRGEDFAGVKTSSIEQAIRKHAATNGKKVRISRTKDTVTVQLRKK